MLKFIFVFMAFLNTAVFAQGNPETAPEDEKAYKKIIVAAWRLSSRISPDPQKLNVVFDKSFFNYLSKDKLTELLKNMNKENGSVVNVSSVSFESPRQGEFLLVTDKDYYIPASITIEEKRGRVIGLFFRPSFKKTASISEPVSKFEKLDYEKKGLFIKKLNELEDTVYAKNETETFAIASSFKLYILAAIFEKGVPLDKVLKLREEDKSLPTGRTRLFPEGAPFTVLSLSEAMISESDNTAADMLIDFLGRDYIEKELPVFYNSHPELNTPFLKTSEVFKLKYSPNLLSEYSILKTRKEKLEFLKSLKKNKIAVSDISPDPKEIKNLEWFSSPEDLCKLMNRFRTRNEPFRSAILALNPGLDIKTGGFKYAGYKGGSESGVISMNWLLQTKNDNWYCVSAVINDEKKPIDMPSVLAIMQEILNLTGLESF